jgi:hypothetical protein
LFETLIGAGLVVVFCVLAWAVGAAAETLIVAGISIAAFGFAYGLPAAFVYHWLLHRSLARAGRLPKRWWLSPTSHHELVPPRDRPRVLVSAAIGGSGFFVIVLGIVLTSLGLWRARGA